MTNGWPHWENMYRGKAADQADWFQPRATSSRRLVEGCADKNAHIVGDGASVRVDDLLGASYRNLTVPDRAEFGAPFSRTGHETEIHHTAAGGEQEFVYCYCVRL
ncbi:hypothetical protein [Thiobacillus sp.]